MPRKCFGRDEAGATLILALVFVLVISLILISIVTLSGTNLIDTAQLQNTRSVQYAADGAVDAAIQAVRYQSPVTACSTNSSFSAGSINGVTNVVVFCQVAAPLNQRQVMFAACASSSSISSFATCKNNAIVVAQVLYDDVQDGCSGGGPLCTRIGQSATVLSWTVELANS